MANGINVDADIADTIAHLAGVRAAIRAETESAAVRAAAKLATHKGKYGHASGGRHSRIKTDFGDTDGHVILEDPDGGALAIEFGRTGAMGRGGPTRGVHAITGIW